MCSALFRFDRTYEELKHVSGPEPVLVFSYRFDRTYEELKQLTGTFEFGAIGDVLIVPMRN